MNNFQISFALKNHPLTRKVFKGVFPADFLPNSVLAKNTCVIVNSAPSSSRGLHWLCIYIGEDGVSFFDPLGQPPDVYAYSIRIFLEKQAQRFGYYDYNICPIQSATSNVCGLYAILFALYKSRGFSIDEFINLFDIDVMKNDCKAITMSNANFGDLLPFKPTTATSLFCRKLL